MKVFNSLILVLATTLAFESQAQYFPSNLDPVHTVYVVYNLNNKALVEKYLQVIDSQNKVLPPDQKIKMTILVSNEDFAQIDKKIPASLKSNVTLVKESSATQPQVLQQEASSGEFAEEDSGSNNEDWLQDVGEFFWSTDNKPSFVYMKDPEDVIQNSMTNFPRILAQKQIQTIPVVGELLEMDSIEGGNIEATPGGTVYVGSEFNAAYRKKLESIVGAKKVIQVPTLHSSVAHVDESYQFIFDNRAENSCKYALVKTDFLDGLRIAMAFEFFDSIDENRDTGVMRPVKTNEYLDSISYFTGVKKEDIKFTNTDFLELLRKFNFKKALRPFPSLFGFRKEDIYVYKVFSAQKSIIEGVRLLAERTKQEGCADLKQISAPALWTYGVFTNMAPIMESEEVYKTTPVSNLTAFTNFVLLNNAIVIPDAKAATQLYGQTIEQSEFQKIGAKFKEIFKERLTKVGFEANNIHFVDMAGSLLGDGAAHCKTNVLRKRK